MYCGKCGTHVDDDAQFCSECGTRIVREAGAVSRPKTGSRHRRKPVVFIVAALLVVAVVVKGVAGGNAPSALGAKKPPSVKSTDYIESLDFNNQLRSLWSNTVSFVQDEEGVYFSDWSHVYRLDLQDGTVTSEISSDESRKTMGLFWENQLYAIDGSVYTGTKDGLDFSACWRLGFEKEENYLYIFNQVVPYDKGYLGILDRELVYAQRKDIQVFSEGPDYVDYGVDRIESVFDQVDVSCYAVYQGRIIVVDSNNGIWAVDPENGTTVQLFGGQLFSAEPAIQGEYIYRVNENTQCVERTSLDGKTREENLLYVGQCPLFKYHYTIVNNVFYYVFQEPGINGECSIRWASIENWSNSGILATGEGAGVDEWIDALYVVDNWIYYGTQSQGFWRVGTDGSAPEKLADFDQVELPDESLPAQDL